MEPPGPGGQEGTSLSGPSHSCPRPQLVLSDHEVASLVLEVSKPLPLKADSSLSQALCPACGLERVDQLRLRLEIAASPDSALFW